MSLLYTTHYMEEAERLCDRIVVVEHGKVSAEDTLSGLHQRASVPHKLVVELVSPSATLASAVGALAGVSSAQLNGALLEVSMTGIEVGPAVLSWLVSQGHPCSHFATDRPSLEHVFLTLTGRSLRDSQ
jgi:ABC-2 type transport system ATP-binding protein